MAQIQSALGAMERPSNMGVGVVLATKAGGAVGLMSFFVEPGFRVVSGLVARRAR